MAIDFSKFWTDSIAEITGLPEYQTCEISILDEALVRYPGPTYPVDPQNPQPDEDINDVTTDGYDPDTDTYRDPIVNGVVYSGQARFIPIRAGIFTGGESQANADTIRSVRFQLPQHAGPKYIRKGLTVKITAAPRNPSLVGRWATVNDDFQGSSAAARTFTASMAIDARPSEV